MHLPVKEPATIPQSVLPPGSFADRGQAKPMIKMVSKLLKTRLGKSRPKSGLTTGDVKIKQRKITYW